MPRLILNHYVAKRFSALMIIVSLIILMPNALQAYAMHNETWPRLGPRSFEISSSLMPYSHMFSSPPLNNTEPQPKMSPSIEGNRSTSSSNAAMGPQTTIVICVEFSNLNHTAPIGEINKMIFEDMNQYYQQVSYGAISIVGRTVGWYRLNYTLSYYGRDGLTVDDSNFDSAIDSWWLIRDAVKASDKDVDFAQYSHVIVVHAGCGEESSKVPDDIWSVEYSGLWVRTSDARSVNDGMIIPEKEARGAVPFGVACHEYGHELGLPDLYEYGSVPKNDVGDWSLMDHGCWDGDPPGSSPSDPMAWSKIKLGWIPSSRIMVVDAGMNVNVTVQPLELETDGYHAIKIPKTGMQYYLVEVRQKIGVDVGLPSSGVLISYVNEALGSGYGKVKLMDSHPLTKTLNDAAFDFGQVYVEPNKFSVSILSSDGKSYLINVNRGGPTAITGQIPDIAIKGIYFEPSAPQSNETVTIWANVINQGTASATNFNINCYIDDDLCKTTRLTLGAGRSANVTVEWIAEAGSHPIRFTVDPTSLRNELNRNDDSLSTNIVVGLVLNIQMPNNIEVKINGTTYQSGEGGKVTTGTLPGIQQIELEKIQSTGNGSRRIFWKWSDGDTSNPRTILVENDLNLTAEYKTQYYVTVNANEGKVTGEGWYDEDSTAQISAITPCDEIHQKSRSIFTEWSGDSVSNMTSLSVIVQTPCTFSANWKVQYYLSATSNVGSTSGSGWYDANSLATFSVQSTSQISNDTRKNFLHWTGDTTTSQASSNIVMNSPKSVSAVWKIQYLLDIVSPYGDPAGQGWYDSGTVANVSVSRIVDAENGTRRVFLDWKDMNSTSPSTSIMLDEPKTVVAEWKTQYKLSFTTSGLPDGNMVNITINSIVVNRTTPFMYSDWYDSQTSLNLNVTTKIKQGFLPYVFDHWTDSTGAKVANVVAVDHPNTLTAVYKMSLGCVIATATFGSELSPEVQFLRNLRDQKILATYAGSQFMIVFNAWYYSFSPSVAATIARNELLRSLSKIILYPLIGILHGSGFTYNALESQPELAVVVTGFVASNMIGTVYFAPIIATFSLIIHKKLKSIRKVKAVLTLLAGSVIGVVVSEALGLDLVMMLSSTLFVLVTISLSVVVFLHLISLVSTRLKIARML
jgi:M6 family metalloprotease-like protein